MNNVQTINDTVMLTQCWNVKTVDFLYWTVVCVPVIDLPQIYSITCSPNFSSDTASLIIGSISLSVPAVSMFKNSTAWLIKLPEWCRIRMYLAMVMAVL